MRAHCGISSVKVFVLWLSGYAVVNDSSQKPMHLRRHFNEKSKSSGGSRGRKGHPPGVKILTISCSFWEILVKSFVGASLVPPPQGNPGSATETSGPK